MASGKPKTGTKMTARNIGGSLLLGVLALSLVGFGTDGFGTSVRHVAEVGGRKIDGNDYARAVQNELRALQAQIGAGFTMEQAREFGLDRIVLEQLITQTTLDVEAERLGLSVGDATVQGEILTVRSFLGPDGQFSREAYRFALQSAGLTEAAFEEEIRADIARSVLQLAIGSAAQAPAALVSPLLEFQAQTRDLSVLTLGAADLTEPVGQPGAAELQAWYDANLERYTLPAAKRLSYAWITPDMMIDLVEIDDATLRAAYDARLAEFVQPERRLVERLIFADQAAADAAFARLQAGQIDFAGLVAERGLTLDDADMGDVTEADLGAAGPGVFALTEPGVVGPLETPLGPALFQMNGVLAAQEVTFEQARAQLRDEVVADRARRMLADELDTYEDLIAGGATLAQLADETPMELGQIDWRAGDSDGIAAYEAFRVAAEAAQIGDFPEIGILDDGGLFALEKVEEVPAAPQPLEDIRTQAVQDWQNAQILTRLRAQAEALTGAAQTPPAPAPAPATATTAPQADADPAAPQAQAPAPARFTGISRMDFLPDVPPAVLRAAFEMEAGSTRIIEDGAQVHVVTLEAVNSPDLLLQEVVELDRALREQLAQSLSQDLYGYFASALRARQPIQVNQAVIDAVNASF